MAAGIYQIRNLVNGKVYVGSSHHVYYRMTRHIEMLQRNGHVNPKLQAAYNKYGHDAFAFEVREFCEVEDLLLIEQEYIDNLDVDEHYNIALVAGSPMRGRKHSEDTRKKLRAARALNHTKTMLGKYHTEDAKRRMSINSSGEKNPMYGMKGELAPGYGLNHTEEFKQRLSTMRTGSGNTMYGKSGALSPTSKKVIVNGVQYDSITLAGAALGVDRQVVARRIKSERFPNYSYA